MFVGLNGVSWVMPTAIFSGPAMNTTALTVATLYAAHTLRTYTHVSQVQELFKLGGAINFDYLERLGIADAQVQRHMRDARMFANHASPPRRFGFLDPLRRLLRPVWPQAVV